MKAMENVKAPVSAADILAIFNRFLIDLNMAITKTIDRLRKMIQERKERVAKEQSATEDQELYEKARSEYLKIRDEMIRENPALQLQEENTCPICGCELVRYEGCYRCKKCGWSRC